ncbi:MAG: prepilin-type N-terminal cleavage/methylation domain-containing protein [Tepidisphaeraceae bacterium]|jgi:prepilin-type N-terminal cleavage/methylation domain-containing protein
MPVAIPPRVRRGFTIIELLVVIGIIAILIGILLPALMQARRQAKDLACESNVRQISQALLIYATENQGLFPPAQDSLLVTWHVRIWPLLYHTPFTATDVSGGGTYSYLTNTIFECPQADLSREGGYNQNDHRKNGYALNISIPGTNGNAGFYASPAYQAIRVREYKRPYKVKCGAQTMMLTDAVEFYVEYYDRGSALNSMDAGFSYGGGMLGALGRHAREKDAWNVAFLDGSVRLMHFNDVPGTPSQYYLVGARLSPGQLISTPGIPDATKLFWPGQDY